VWKCPATRADRSLVLATALLALLFAGSGCAAARAHRRAHRTVEAALASGSGLEARVQFRTIAGDPARYAPALLRRLKAMRHKADLTPADRRLLYLAVLVRDPRFAPHIVRLCGAEAPRLQKAYVSDPRDFALAFFVAFLGTDLPGALTGPVQSRLEWLGRQTPEPHHTAPGEFTPALRTDPTSEPSPPLETGALVERLFTEPSFSDRASAADEVMGRSDLSAFLPDLFALAATAPADDPYCWIEGDLQLAILRAEKLRVPAPAARP